MSRASPSLLDLNSDVLVHIFEELRPGRHLRPLSECSKSLRSLALPILFRDCLVKMKKPITTGFLPRSLWPYVCCLLLVDACPVRSPKESAHRTDPYSYSLRYTDDPMLCGTLDATVLRRSLPAMPRLKRVALLLHSREVHGIRADVAAAIFAAPQVRIIRISSFLFSPKQSLLPDSSQDLPPLTSFRYTKDAFREPPRAYPFEVDAIRLMLSKLHRSLEVLELPAEAAPLDVMSRLDWSRLQHLTLMGEFPSDSPTPLIDVIARMPCLRVLILRLAILRNMDRQCIWPPGWSVVNPLPEIEELVVTHPSPEDLLYTHLPQSIRRLSLCCSPCYALQVWTPDRYDRWISPLPAASELFRLLSASPLPRLEHLAIEYNPDDQEDDLWRFFSCAYPQLTSIEFHRMKLPWIAWPAVDLVATIANALSRLRGLRDIRLNLNISYGEGPYDPRDCQAWLYSMIRETAEEIAGMLRSSVTRISLLVPRRYGAEWVHYDISIMPGSKHIVSETLPRKYLVF